MHRYTSSTFVDLASNIIGLAYIESAFSITPGTLWNLYNGAHPQQVNVVLQQPTLLQLQFGARRKITRLVKVDLGLEAYEL